MARMAGRLRHALLWAVVLVVGLVVGAALGYPGSGDPSARAASSETSVVEQNLDDDGFIAVHEQGIASVRVAGGRLRARQAGIWTVGVSNWPTVQRVSGNVGITNWPTALPVSGTVEIGNLPATLPVSGSVSAAQAGDWEVDVGNWPTTQPVSGTVGISNWPTTQAVSGTVNVGNLPATQPVSGTVGISNWPTTQPVSGTVGVSNWPTTQTVSGTVNVGNLPATQPVSGTVNAVQSGAWSIASTQPAPLRGELAGVDTPLELPVDAVITDILVNVGTPSGTPLPIQPYADEASCSLEIIGPIWLPCTPNPLTGLLPEGCTDFPSGIEIYLTDGLNQIHMTTGIAPPPGEAWTLEVSGCTGSSLMWTGYQG